MEPVADGFSSPVALITPGDGSHRLFVVDQVGVIWIISGGKRLEEPFLDLRDDLVTLSTLYDERGLLGLAFHPEFSTNGRFYISYSAPVREGLSAQAWDHTTYISEFIVSGENPNRADPASQRVLLAMDKPGYNYEAGNLAFGPDGFLYIATGDSVHSPAEEAGQYAQETFSLLGKILRIDVERRSENGEYGIPPDNPFLAGGGRPEVYAYGLRNPYRFSFDMSAPPEEPRLFAADVGQAVMEEVNLIIAGGNYGWPVREGTTCFNPEVWSQPLENCPDQGLIDPVIAYAHREDLSAVIGGAVYHGNALPALEGGYVFGDWGRGDGRLFVAFPPLSSTDLWELTEIQVEIPSSPFGVGQLLGIGQDENGELYLLTKAPGVGPFGDTGRIFKIQ